MFSKYKNLIKIKGLNKLYFNVYKNTLEILRKLRSLLIF